jgi:hypothetical protein
MENKIACALAPRLAAPHVVDVSIAGANIRETRKPDEGVIVLANRQARKIVSARFGGKRRDDGNSDVLKPWFHIRVEEVAEGPRGFRVEVMDARENGARVSGARAWGRSVKARCGEAGGGSGWVQEQDIV